MDDKRFFLSKKKYNSNNTRVAQAEWIYFLFSFVNHFNGGSNVSSIFVSVGVQKLYMLRSHFRA